MAFDVREDALAALKAEQDAIETFCGSVASESDVKACVQRTVEAFGAVNALVNNAGIFRDGLLEKLLAGVPLRRAGKPEEIYRAVEFIVECDYFTGRCIDVDGGITM